MRLGSGKGEFERWEVAWRKVSIKRNNLMERLEVQSFYT
jgi:hypothetical protein